MNFHHELRDNRVTASKGLPFEWPVELIQRGQDRATAEWKGRDQRDLLNRLKSHELNMLRHPFGRTLRSTGFV